MGYVFIYIYIYLSQPLRTSFPTHQGFQKKHIIYIHLPHVPSSALSARNVNG